eukprot:3390652-Amphidinium_carterae.1
MKHALVYNASEEHCDQVSTSTTLDMEFRETLTRNLAGTEGVLPVHIPLRYLAYTAEQNSSWAKATAYLILVEGLLFGRENVSWELWNSTKALMFLAEQHLENCEPNTTVYHLMLSRWPFWDVLARMERQQLDVRNAQAVAEMVESRYKMPHIHADLITSKWQHLISSRLGRVVERPPESLVQNRSSVHVALAADVGQIDGIIVTLNSATRNAGANASRVCFHLFALNGEIDFLIKALMCAFKQDMTQQSASTFLLLGMATLVVHVVDEEHIRARVGMSGSAQRKTLLAGEDVSHAFASDTGNLFAAHNFVRFVLHELLPDIPIVLYIDVDVVVRGDVCELFDLNVLSLNGSVSTIAAVQRTNQPLRMYVDVLQPAFPGWVPSEAPSFNAGVMLIDLFRWRSRGATDVIAEWVSMNQDRQLWLHGSQPPLLLLFHDEVAPLDWRWNIDGLGHRLNYPKSVLQEARILHWTGPLKPWRHHGVNRLLWEPYTLHYCPEFSGREHTTTCRPDSWFC